MPTRPDRGVLKVGYGPLSRATATRVVEALASGRPDLPIRLDEDTTPELLARVAAHDLDAAAVVETPAAGRRDGVRVDALRTSRCWPPCPPRIAMRARMPFRSVRSPPNAFCSRASRAAAPSTTGFGPSSEPQARARAEARDTGCGLGSPASARCCGRGRGPDRRRLGGRADRGRRRRPLRPAARFADRSCLIALAERRNRRPRRDRVPPPGRTRMVGAQGCANLAPLGLSAIRT